MSFAANLDSLFVTINDDPLYNLCHSALQIVCHGDPSIQRTSDYVDAFSFLLQERKDSGSYLLLLVDHLILHIVEADGC